MNTIKKHYLLLLGLFCAFCLCAGTSIFMALETSDFFKLYYKSDSIRWSVAAFILEAFMLLMSMMRFEGHFIFTAGSKMVSGLLFLMIVSIASFPHISSDLNTLEVAGRSDKVSDIVSKAIDHNKEAQQYFMDTKQRTNVAIRVLKNDKLLENLISKKITPTNSILLSIIFVVGVRFLLQLCNILTAYGIGLQFEKLKIAVKKVDLVDEIVVASEYVDPIECVAEVTTPIPPNGTAKSPAAFQDMIDSLHETIGKIQTTVSTEEASILPVEANGRELSITPEDIRSELRKLNLTQADIAVKANISKGAVSSAINHFNSVISVVAKESKRQAEIPADELDTQIEDLELT